MLNNASTGGHNYYEFQWKAQKFLLTLGDCDTYDARRFLSSLRASNIESLYTAIMTTIWDANVFEVQDSQQDTYLIGQTSTQEFINTVAQETTFFGICPFDHLCLAYVSFHPFSPDRTTRWNIQLDFGRASEFHVNYDPNNSRQNPQHLE